MHYDRSDMGDLAMYDDCIGRGLLEEGLDMIMRRAAVSSASSRSVARHVVANDT